jgi:hypothetical protein
MGPGLRRDDGKKHTVRAYAAVQTPPRIHPYHRALVRNPVIA